MSVGTVNSDRLYVRHARLYGVDDGQRARLRMEAVLGGISVTAAGLPPRAILVIQRMAPGTPLPGTHSAREETFPLSVLTQLQRNRRDAGRPWDDARSSSAKAVLFADEAELCACLIRDHLRGTLTGRWWRRPVLEEQTLPEWWRRHLLPRGDLLPPVLALLAGQGWAVPWVSRLGDTELDRGSAAIAQAHGLVVPMDGLSTGPPPLNGVAGGEPPGPEAPSRAWQELSARVPEVLRVMGSGSRARLLALGLGLQRDPAWTRGPALARALAVLVPDAGIDAPAAVDMPGTANGRERESPLDRLTFTSTAGDAQAPAIDMRMEDRVDLSRQPDAQPLDDADEVRTPPCLRFTSNIGRAADPRLRSGDTLAGPISEAIPLPEVAEVPVAMVPDRSDPDLRHSTPVGQRPSAETGAAAGDVAAEPVSTRRPVVIDFGARSDDAGTHTGAAHMRGADTPDQEQLASRIAPGYSTEEEPVPPQSRSHPDPLPPVPLAISVETRFGSLFYLLNLALALGLYGDFTQPRRPGIRLSPWDWLALVGRAWLGRTLVQDPLWDLLRRLAGRARGQPPGTGFVPPVVWCVPADWPLPPNAAGPVEIQVCRSRLWLRHPAGFLLADLPRDTGIGTIAQARRLCARWPALGHARLTRTAVYVPREMNARHRRTAAPTLTPSLSPRGRGRFGTPATAVMSRRRSRCGKRRGDPDSTPMWLPEDRALARWLAWQLPYLETRLALALGVEDPAIIPALVCRHRARVQVSAAALDIHLSLADLPIALRIAGLDRDPGWIPAAGRSIAFHFL